jgi:hypothetical protein
MLLWRGDAIVLQPNFDMMKMLKAVTTFKLERLYLVSLVIFTTVMVVTSWS